MELLHNISHCGEVEKAKSDSNHPCHKIVKSQKDLVITNFQLPEPWNGHIDTAEILFISSNPSIDPNENYPTSSWNDNDIVSFFENRFEISINELRKKPHSFWRFLNKVTSWILNTEEKAEKYNNKNCNFLNDSACSTEVVHCKSKRGYGVTPYCLKTCFNKWLREILKIFKGNYVIVVGTKLEDFIKSHLDQEYFVGRKFAYTPHPSEQIKGLTDEVRKEQILKQLGLI